MKIKIRNTQPKVGLVRLGWSGEPGANERYRVSSVWGTPSGGSGWWVARSDCLSLSCHVKMVLRKCIFCIPSANEQHRYKTTTCSSLPSPLLGIDYPSPPMDTVVSILFRVFFAQLDFYLFCSLAIFMPLLCLLFAFAAAFWPQMLLRL